MSIVIGTAPDNTAKVSAVGDPATTAAIRAAIASDHILHVASEHWLTKTLGDIVKKAATILHDLNQRVDVDVTTARIGRLLVVIHSNSSIRCGFVTVW